MSSWRARRRGPRLSSPKKTSSTYFCSRRILTANGKGFPSSIANWLRTRSAKNGAAAVPYVTVSKMNSFMGSDRLVCHRILWYVKSRGSTLIWRYILVASAVYTYLNRRHCKIMIGKSGCSLGPESRWSFKDDPLDVGHDALKTTRRCVVLLSSLITGWCGMKTHCALS